MKVTFEEVEGFAGWRVECGCGMVFWIFDPPREGRVLSCMLCGALLEYDFSQDAGRVETCENRPLVD